MCIFEGVIFYNYITMHGAKKLYRVFRIRCFQFQDANARVIWGIKYRPTCATANGYIAMSILTFQGTVRNCISITC